MNLPVSELAPVPLAEADPPPSAVPPVVVRLAGLPAEALEALTSPLCLDLASQRLETLTELQKLRAALIEEICRQLADFDAESRRYLLAVKRAAFNRRDLRPLAAQEKWSLVRTLAPDAAARIPGLETRVAEIGDDFTSLHARELDRERRQVASQAGDARFLRGIALSRPGLVEKIRSKAPALVAAERLGAAAKWERSLLRFVTRAAGKLSPNSTLTTCALAALAPPGSPALRPLTGRRREISLLRADRPALEQILSLLLTLPAVRERCLLEWNDTVEEIEPGSFAYLREDRWIVDPARARFRREDKTRIRLRLDNQALAPVRRVLAEARLPYAELLARLAGATPAGPSSEAELRPALEQLLRLGMVLLLPPWPAHEPRLERRLLEFLRSLPAAGGNAELLAAAEELVSRQQAFATAERPDSEVRRLGDVVARLAGAALPPEHGDMAPQLETRFFEEVLELGASQPEPGPQEERASWRSRSAAILSVATDKVHEILDVAALVSRFASLFHPRHELLLTLAAWWRKEASGAASLPFAEVGRAFGPLFQDFQDFRRNRPAGELWNPLASPAIERLAELRRQLRADYAELLAAAPGRARLERDALARLVGALPERFAPLLAPGAFVQPADAAGRSWVFNSLFEGTGRYLSRITPALEGELEVAFLDHLVARSRVLVGGERAELVEVKYPFGHLVRAHHPQTARVFAWRGVYLGLPPERFVGLPGLRVAADLDNETFRLLDTQARRLLPVHVSTLEEEMLPNLLRLLLLFGPGDIRSAYPTAHADQVGENVRFRRLGCGALVLRRAGWALALAPLRTELAGLAGAALHLAVDAWRRGLELPLLVYYYEAVSHGAPGKRKPQYLDFSSPSLVANFAESVARFEGDQMLLEEALPAPADFPPDGQGGRRAFELLIDPRMLAPREGERCPRSAG